MTDPENPYRKETDSWIVFEQGVLAAKMVRDGGCSIEPAFSQHEYAVDYCDTHDQPASDCTPAAPRIDVERLARALHKVPDEDGKVSPVDSDYAAAIAKAYEEDAG